ncbi:MAG: Crp/Fnr family transcriptional regulator [Hyphomicrobiales bacterium]|nr:MAG: Crp/Fnr family transcriptional regulator [Hyphomicrobiales bacterium]
MSPNWIEQFQGLASLDASIKSLMTQKSNIISYAKNSVIFGSGKAPDHFLLLLEGTVRVQQLSEAGREIVLYRVHAGQSCVLTTACLLAYEDYAAEGIAESEVKAMALPRVVFNQLIAQSDEFRRFVFSAYSRRMTDLFAVIEDIAFQRMDIRLAQKLLELVDEDAQIKSTHQKMAAELGSAREVISRLLQEFQRRNWIAQSRGTIKLLNRGEIKKLATTNS